jgi:general secretion pathway protein K
MRMKQNGIALVIVLWVVMLLSVMAGSFAHTMRTETTLVTHASEIARGRALAEAGLAYAAYRLLVYPDPENPWPIDGTPLDWTFGGGTVSIAVRDAGGRIDINHAERGLFIGLLTSAGGLMDEEAEILMDRIEDFRDPDDLERPNGAESSAYEQAGYPRGPKNAPFESVDELQQVMGVDERLFQRIADALTVYSRQTGINPEAAPAKVLLALPGIDPILVEEYLQQREAARAEQLPPPPFPFASDFLTGVGGLAYHVRLTARLANGVETFVTTTISGRQRSSEAFHVDSWREGRPAEGRQAVAAEDTNTMNDEP